jgi:parallel beta-helix repeat protein
MTRRIALNIGVLAATAFAVTTAGADGITSSSISSGSCVKFAAPNGSDTASGGTTAPFRTVGKLVASLQSGQAGCVRAGTYSEDVAIAQSGITLAGYPGEDATIVGRFWIKQGADGVVVTGLNLDGKNDSLLPSPTVNGDDAHFVGNDVTNDHTEICFLIGSSWGRAQRTLIQRNRVHDCGKLPSQNQDHGIYVSAADDTQILDNVIYDNVDRGIQLYPDAQRTVVRGNIIDGNGEGIIFSGAGGLASSANIVDHNVITSSTIRADVESWYPSGNPVGVSNVVHDNCLVAGAGGTIDTSAGGFTAINNVTVSDARYVDRGSGDFRLATTSTCATYVANSLAPAGLNGEPPVGDVSTPPPPPPPPPPPTWQPAVGQRVKITDSSSSDNGKVGEIAYLSQDGKRALLLMDSVAAKAVLVADIGPASP